MPYQPYQSTWQNPYLPAYNQGQPVTPMVQPYQQPVNGVVKVNGRDSAMQYQLPPNSMSPALFDNNGKAGYDDGMGYSRRGGMAYDRQGRGYRRGYERESRRGYRGQSRDSMGRYTSRRGYRRMDGYGHTDMMAEVRQMMETADPQEREQLKMQLRQMMTEM